MNIGEIAERLIQAAEIEEAASRFRVGPKLVRSLPLPYEHSQADKNGWGTERLAEDRKAFFENISSQPTARQITEAEESGRWYALVVDSKERSALAAWVRCMISKREFFKDWCFKTAGIHPETGRRRKDRALARIEARLVRETVQHCTIGHAGVLPDDPQTADIDGTFPDASTSGPRAFTWRDDDAFSSFLTEGIPGEFDWARKRNERRRQQEAKRRKEAA